MKKQTYTPTDTWKDVSPEEREQVINEIMERLPRSDTICKESEFWKRTELALNKLNIYELTALCMFLTPLEFVRYQRTKSK